ncbi:hypothetical protein XENOCAPTIV_009325 [Xenoophorus captivus]|uniref:Secreted protein n=1 Tax=Xenoophorus captivus TaxID=1517983 RepID=A0ABV0R932_9TELE
MFAWSACCCLINPCLDCSGLCAPPAPTLRPVVCGPSPSITLPVGGRTNEPPPPPLCFLGGDFTPGRTDHPTPPRIISMQPKRVKAADVRGYQGGGLLKRAVQVKLVQLKT